MSNRRELAHRANDGIEVSLIWDAADGSLTVAVVDCRVGEAFEVPVAGQSPLEVFYHPFAYAARREGALAA